MPPVGIHYDSGDRRRKCKYQLTRYWIEAYSIFCKRLASAQSLLFYWAMKSNTLSNKLVLVSAAVCALMLALSHNAGAVPHPMPPSINNVPDGGATIMLLGAALGALGLARRFLSR